VATGFGAAAVSVAAIANSSATRVATRSGAWVGVAAPAHALNKIADKVSVAVVLFIAPSMFEYKEAQKSLFVSS
jgi:hypothetical protein